MWAGGGLIHTGAADFSQVVAHHEVIEGFLLRFTQVDRAVFKAEPIIVILLKGDLGPLLKIIIPIFFVQQVVSILVVNLNVWDSQLVHDSILTSLKLLEDVAQDSGDDAALIPLIATAHRISFTAAGLPVGEDRPVITFETIVDDGLGQNLEYFLLAAILFEYVTKAVFLLLLDWWELSPVRL